MILQRDAKPTIWGWAAAGEKITVRFNNKSYKTTTGNDGKWKVQLQPTKAGGPFAMDITGSNKITLKDILVGDVWLCTGQSNMVHQMKIHNVLYADDIAKANFPAIRQFWIPTVANLQGPQQDVSSGSWKWANPTDVGDFSAVAYFFARQLHQKYGGPIGIINASYGGAPIEAWISEGGFKDFPTMLQTIAKNKDTAVTPKRSPSTGNRPPTPEDKGMT
ncbi:MAG TPA: sialate O-acetylesterase, partial [Chitinophagaceae bacterium]|nr:sialate O-acetylesterase [Chitinophagaceae bacterium]